MNYSPQGGGGYLVASKLLGPYPGLIAGCALVVDYVLTIAVSISSGVDAIFSFLPPHYQILKIYAIFLVIAILILLNLRGVKESVIILTPIFITFVVTHLILIITCLFQHYGAMPDMVVHTWVETGKTIQTQGLFVVMFIILKAYSMGGGTYTGIEAVSNGIQILREPKVHTAKKTMFYMATSLAFTAGGIMICYLLVNVDHRPGMTLNAVLTDIVARKWHIGTISYWSSLFLCNIIIRRIPVICCSSNWFY